MHTHGVVCVLTSPPPAIASAVWPAQAASNIESVTRGTLPYAVVTRGLLVIRLRQLQAADDQGVQL
jgi:hypothetical protein